MKIQHVLAGIIAAAFLGFLIMLGCSNQNPVASDTAITGSGSTTTDEPGFEMQKKIKKKATSRYRAILTAAPGVITDASGRVTIRVNARGTAAHYRITASNLQDAYAAHIHVREPGQIDGPAVVTLYDGKLRTVDGMFANGNFKAADLTGPLAGGTISELVGAFQAGLAYVNVNTLANPGGEIRGTIEPEPPHGKKKQH
jgi:hypothetical protein